MITIIYSAIDGYRAKRKFKTLAGARRYAQERVGANPEIGTGYAVSGDAVGKVEVFGDASLSDLFPSGPVSGPPKIYVVGALGAYFTSKQDAQAAISAAIAEDHGFPRDGDLDIQECDVTADDFR
jgi:hypothetical protein